MAVEIPVVIDIEGAFKDAASRVGSYMMPLRDSLDKLTKDLGRWQEVLGKSKIGGDAFIVAAKNIQNISEKIAEADYEMKRYASNESSIRQMTMDLAEMERRWAEMGAAQKYASGGKELSEDAKKLIADYKKVTEEIQRQGKSLSQIIAEEQKILQLKNKGNQLRRYETAILNTNVKTMRVLSEQERILSERLGRTRIGTQQFDDLTVKLQNVRKEMAAVRKQVDGTSTSMKKMGDSAAKTKTSIDATNTSLKKQSTILTQLKSIAAMYISVFGGLRLARNIRETTAELELQRVALGSILQDTERATSLFRQIKAAALKSPFEIKDLVTYTKQLSAYRIETDKLFDVTMRLADVSAGLGVDMNRLILAYGQVRAASVLRGQELRQFTEAGIPLVELLADKFEELGRKGTTTADVFELISKRMVSFSMIESIFKDMTSAGGTFYEMQEKQSETLKGKWMKLKDAVTIMYDEIGNTSAVHGAMTKFIDDITFLTRSWRNVAQWIRVGISTMVTYSVVSRSASIATAALTKAEAMRYAITKKQVIIAPAFVSKIIGETTAKKISAAATKQLTVAQYNLAAANTVLSKTFWKLSVALLSNPWAAAVAGVVALGTGIYALVKNLTRAKFTYDSFEASIEKFSSVTRKSEDIERLISIYEEFHDQTDLAKKDQEKLTNATKELARAYPAAISGINAESGALDINIQKVKDLTEAENELHKNRLEIEKREAEKDEARIKKRLAEIDQILSQGGKVQKVYGGTQIIALSEKQIKKLDDEVLALREELMRVQQDIQNADNLLKGLKVTEGEETTTETLSGWRLEVSKIQEEKKKAGAVPIFGDDEIEKFESVLKFSKELKKKEDEITQSLKTNQELFKTATEDARSSIQSDITADEKTLEMIKAIKLALGIVFKSSSSSSRDTRLSDLKKDISELTNAYKKFLDLRKYLGEEESLNEIGVLFPQLADWKPTFNNLISKLGGMRDDVSKKLRNDPKNKTLLEMQRALDTEISNLKFDDLKNKVETSLKRVEEQLKHSEAARDLYKNILGLTGDEELSQNLVVSVYGDPGADIGARIKESIEGALDSLKIAHDSDLGKKLLGAAETLDFHGVLADIDSIPEEIRNVVKTAASSVEKYNMDIANSYAKLLMQYDEIKQQQVNIANKAAQNIEAIEKGLSLELLAIAKKQISDEEKVRLEEQARARAKSAKEAVAREKALEMSRLERDYRMFFSSIGVISDESARRIARTQKKMLTEQFEKGEISLAKFKRELREVDEQMKKYETSRGLFGSYLSGGIEGLTGKFNEYADSLRAISHNIQVGGGKSGIFSLDDETMSYIDKIGMIMGGKAFGVDGVSGRKNVADQLVSALMAASKNADEFKEKLMAAIDYAAEGADSFASSFASGMSTAGFWVHNVSTLIKELDVFNQDALKTPKWLDAFASTVTWTLGVGGDEAWDRLADLNEYATSGFEKLSQGNIVGAIADNVRGLIDFWGPNIKKINRQLKEQDDTVEGLEYQYNRLENSIQKAFGSDYIVDYNKQLDALYAKQAAYEEQARLEESKEKKKDLDKIKEYENAARDVGDQILDMKGQLAEFFTGTDITSAAKDFATAWIDAYKEFGSTTDAMKDKFNEMIQNMIENSLAAKIMQEILSPLFQQIDDLAADSELSGADIAEIATAAPEYIEKINAAMVTLMNGLNAAGYNVRQQPGQFTGIKRNIANATEESVNGLTQAMNVNNFYMSHIPAIDANVAQILAIMTGGTAENPATGASYQLNSDQVLQYMSALPNIDQNIAELLRYVKSVISDKNSSSNINVVAVRA